MNVTARILTPAFVSSLRLFEDRMLVTFGGKKQK
jgi:hypothetical protein